MLTFEQFSTDQDNNQEVTVILTEYQDYKDIIKNSKSYGATYIKHSYQKQNHLISIRFKIDYDLLSQFMVYLNSEDVEDIITD
jgi:putative IMPACT (imprinted ancient) family translation regulator